MNKILTFILLSAAWSLSDAQCEGGFDGWVPFKDTKCFKLYDQLLTMQEAEDSCFLESSSDNIPPLATIESVEEQEFITQYVFSQLNVLDNVWLGASGVNGTGFSWLDGAPLEFTNWHEGYPSGVEDHNCVQMVPKGDKAKKTKEIEAGKWTDTSCLRHNYGLCQKMQKWSSNKLQLVSMATTKKLEKTVVELKEAKEKLTSDLDFITKNPVPIGFVYVQLPNQPDARSTWPGVEWADVTTEYAGLFFRAEGAGSLEFGMTQTDSTRQINRVQYESSREPQYFTPIDIPLTGWSEYVLTGALTDTTINWFEGLRFLTSDVEVRPRNTAVRIWKRIA